MGAGEREQRGSLPLIGELPTELTPPVPVGPRGTSAAFPCVPTSWVCGVCDEESCPIDAPILVGHLESFRVCFDQFGNSCTEWKHWYSNSCEDCDE